MLTGIAMVRESVRGLRRFFAFFASDPTTRSSILADAGGAPFYIVLLILYGVLLIGFSGLRLARA